MTTAPHACIDETGMSMVFVSVGFMAFFAATTLAIDVGLFMTARSQAQNSADAARWPARRRSSTTSFDDRIARADRPCRARINTAQAQQGRSAVTSRSMPPDVTFPLGRGGQDDRVQVWVFRNDERGNPVRR